MEYSDVDVREILEYLSIRNLNDIGDEVQFSCPFPEHYRGDRRPSSSINKDNGRYHCFGCGRSGTLITFLAEHEGVTEAIAIRWVRERYIQTRSDKSLRESIRNILEKTKKESRKVKLIPEDTVDLFRVDWRKCERAYRTGDLPRSLSYPTRNYGIHFDTLERFEIGYDEKTERIAIPIRTAEGGLVGWKGRSTSGDFPKYLALGDKPDEDKYGFKRNPLSHAVFGLNTSGPHVIVCEGEFDAISLRQKGFDGSVACGTANLSDKQRKLLYKHAESAIILFDPDIAGTKGAEKVAKALSKHLPVKIAKAIEGDPAEMTPEQIQKALNTTINPITNKQKGSEVNA